MGATKEARSLTVRLRPELYAAATDLAKKRCISLNTLVQESLAAVIREEEDREMYEAAELLGQFPEECDVEYAFAAQSEVVLREEP
ncbi:MAG TPA: toxin-antitoxin system HicB family antitoxin [Chthonomonadaceae bacterium]|nr:toxin-antitoxin system HicB family antitoxin [Chthonomonadaceae bacterium]